MTKNTNLYQQQLTSEQKNRSAPSVCKDYALLVKQRSFPVRFRQRWLCRDGSRGFQNNACRCFRCPNRHR